MYIAQKILKSMSSITNDMIDENNQFDDLTSTPKSVLMSSISNSPLSDRQLSLTPPSDENFTIDSLSESPTDVTDMETPQVLEATSITFQSDQRKTSTPGSIDTLDYSYD